MFNKQQPKELLFTANLILPLHAVKKNNKQIKFNKRTGKSFIASNNKTLAVENQLSVELNRIRITQNISTITERVSAKFLFYFPKDKYFTKKGLINKKLPDISNLYQLPEDALEKAKIIENDYLIDNHDGSRRIPHDSDQYLLEISLYKSDIIYTI